MKRLLSLLLLLALLCACGAETPDAVITETPDTSVETPDATGETPESPALPEEFPQLWPEDFPFGQDAAAAAEQMGLDLGALTLRELREDEHFVSASGLSADQLRANALTLRGVAADGLTVVFQGDALWYVSMNFYARDFASTADWLDAVLDWYAALGAALTEQGYVEEAIGLPLLSGMDGFDPTTRNIARWTKDGQPDGLQAQLCLCGPFEETMYVSFMLGVHLAAPA